MEKKKIGVTLDPELHHTVKIEATKKGITLEGAYTQALGDWLAKVAGTFATDGSQSEPIMNFLAGYLKQHAPNSPERKVLLAEIGYPDPKAVKATPKRGRGKKMG